MRKLGIILTALCLTGCGIGFNREQTVLKTEDKSVTIVASWIDVSPATNLHKYEDGKVICYLPENSGIWCMKKESR